MPDVPLTTTDIVNGQPHAVAPRSSAEGIDDLDALWDTCIDHIVTAAGYVDRLGELYEGKGVSPDVRRLADQLHLMARTAYGVAAHA